MNKKRRKKPQKSFWVQCKSYIGMTAGITLFLIAVAGFYLQHLSASKVEIRILKFSIYGDFVKGDPYLGTDIEISNHSREPLTIKDFQLMTLYKPSKIPIRSYDFYMTGTLDEHGFGKREALYLQPGMSTRTHITYLLPLDLNDIEKKHFTEGFQAGNIANLFDKLYVRVLDSSRRSFLSHEFFSQGPLERATPYNPHSPQERAAPGLVFFNYFSHDETNSYELRSRDFVRE